MSLQFIDMSLTDLFGRNLKCLKGTIVFYSFFYQTTKSLFQPSHGNILNSKYAHYLLFWDFYQKYTILSLLTKYTQLNPIPLNLITYSSSPFSNGFKLCYPHGRTHYGHDEGDRGIAGRSPSQYFHCVQTECIKLHLYQLNVI